MTATAPRRRANAKRTSLTIAVIVIVVVALGFWWWDSHRKGVTFRAVFSASVGVYPGSAVRILGVPVGTVDSVSPHGTTVTIAMHLDPGRNAAAGTGAVIISPNLVSDRYVQLTSPYTSGAKLRSGTLIPSSRTRVPVEVDDLYRSLTSLSTALGPKGANSDGALSRALDVGAANLDGNGKNFNTALTNLSAASRTFDASKDQIFGTIDNLRTFTATLKTNNGNLQTVNSTLASVAQTFANDRQTFAQALNQLGTALALVQTFIKNNRAALTSQVGALNTTASTLAKRRASLIKVLSAAPLLVQNFIRAYDPQRNLLRGRVDLNELTVFANQAKTAAARAGTTPNSVSSTSLRSGSSSSDGSSDSSAPAGMLPAANVATGGGR